MSRPGVVEGIMRDAGIRAKITKSASERMAEATPWRPELLYADPRKVDERWSNACARIGRICEGASAVSNGVTVPSIAAACKTATVPKLAHAFAEIRFYLMTKDKPHTSQKTDHNPFRHMPDLEALAKFRVMVERICDASTGVLGSWCTK